MRVFAGVKGGVGDVAHGWGQRQAACALRFSALRWSRVLQHFHDRRWPMFRNRFTEIHTPAGFRTPTVTDSTESSTESLET